MPHEQRRFASLDGFNIVVTGGSSGIGKATCLRLAEQGARVVVHFHQNRTGAEETVADISGNGGTALLHQADLRDADDRDHLIETSFSHWGRIDAWIHNAGADVLTGTDSKLSFAEKLDLLWSVDVRSTMLLARAVGQRMRNQPPASVAPSMVFIGWDQAAAGMEGDAGNMFGPIKSAVMAFSDSMAQTLAPHVRVNCVAPGWIQTAWGRQTDEAWNRRAVESSLMLRWGKPEDVAAVIAFLCSPEASFVNGQTIEVNGGWNRKPKG
ncbi:MAG: SDR family oxidoreductase [Pirellulaceae bacterium]